MIQMMPNNWFILNLLNLIIIMMMMIKFNKKKMKMNNLMKMKK